MILTIDIGNSAIKAGLFEAGRLFDTFNASSTADVAKYILSKKFSRAAISSVHPERLHAITDTIGKNVVILSSSSKFHFSVNYGSPKTLGVDRLCSLEGAYHFLLQHEKLPAIDFPIMTIDFGTATTINIVVNNAFIGGLIIPGIATMLHSLAHNTAQLPHVALGESIPIIGTDTDSCIASGVVHTTAASIEKVFTHIAATYKAEPKVFLTGGNSKAVQGNLNIPFTYLEELNLLGIFSAAKSEHLF